LTVRLRAPAGEVDAAVERGLASIRAEFDVPGQFRAEVQAAAREAANSQPGDGHVDRTGIAFVTLDPESATDLDQALYVEPPAGADADVVLHYAIADVGFFVEPGGALDREAWRRGLTIYLPDGRAPLYPPALSEAAASLLPDGPRPAVVFTVKIDSAGAVALDGVQRAIVRSRAKLAYESVGTEDLPDGFEEVSRRIAAAEERRGAPRVEFPEQELECTDGRWTLRFRPRLPSEDHNAGLSLATNLAAADALYAAGTGLYRVMSDAGEHAHGRLRHAARAFGLDWPRGMSLAAFERSLSTDDPRGAAFLLAVRRASGRASYEAFTPGVTPWHSAMAATYVHATAPLRRLADRYVNEAALAVVAGRALPEHVERAFTELPATMERAESLANRVDAAVIDFAEAVMLRGREGEVFRAVVVDEDQRGVSVQLVDPAVLTRVDARHVDPGDDVDVRLVEADPDARTTRFERVG
jgi:exoribonuclease R